MILTIEATSAQELKQKIQDLADVLGIKMENMPSPVIAGGMTERAVEMVLKGQEEVGAGTEGKPGKERKPRRSQATIASEATATGAVTEPEVVKDEPTNTEEAPAEITKADIGEWTKKVSTAKDILFAREVMAKFTGENGEPCIRISDIKVSDYADYVNACKSALASLEKSA